MIFISLIFVVINKEFNYDRDDHTSRTCRAGLRVVRFPKSSILPLQIPVERSQNNIRHIILAKKCFIFKEFTKR